MKNTLPILAFSAVLLVILWSLGLPQNGPKPSAEAPAAEQNDVQVGGDFTLTDQNGMVVHADDYRGRVMLVFFGFTHCPDICPVTTAILSKTMDMLGADAEKVAPIFITVDPQRDTPEVMKAYLANFNPRMIGLTGSEDEVKAAADAYKAYYAPSQPQGDEHGDHDANYTVDHSGFVYLMGKNGKYVRHFPYNVPEQELADAVKAYMKENM